MIMKLKTNCNNNFSQTDDVKIDDTFMLMSIDM